VRRCSKDGEPRIGTNGPGFAASALGDGALPRRARLVVGICSRPAGRRDWGARTRPSRFRSVRPDYSCRTPARPSGNRRRRRRPCSRASNLATPPLEPRRCPLGSCTVEPCLGVAPGCRAELLIRTSRSHGLELRPPAPRRHRAAQGGRRPDWPARQDRPFRRASSPTEMLAVAANASFRSPRAHHWPRDPSPLLAARSKWRSPLALLDLDVQLPIAGGWRGRLGVSRRRMRRDSVDSKGERG
jgi:hypothetical protein